MSKCRNMYAGSSGSISGRTNNFSRGNGNGKWQGLPPTTNKRSGLISYILTNAYGNNRNKVYCLNQLSGTGRFGMFSSSADGIRKNCS